MNKIPIECFSEKLDAFLNRFASGLSEPQKKNVLKLIQALLKNNNASMKALSERCIDKRVPSTFARFLSSSTWEADELILSLMTYFQSLKSLKTVKDGVISIDDTISKKSGKHVKSAGYCYSHSDNKIVFGQNIVVSHYKDAKKEYPLNYSLYISKKALLHEEGRRFKTRLERAYESVLQAYFSGIRGQTILIDSWYVTTDFISKIVNLGYHWVGRIKSNRICYLNGERLSVKELAKIIPDDEWKKTPLLYKTSKKHKSEKTQYIASRTVDLKTLGRIKMVFVRPTLEDDVVLFIGSDRFDLSAIEILKLYTERWRIETFFRDSKQNIALSGYMGRSIIGFERFLSVVFVAYKFIKYLSLTGFWGRNRLKRGTTFGAELDNYHQLCFENFISVIYDVSSTIENKEALIFSFRQEKHYEGQLNLKPVKDYLYHDLKSHILAAVG